MSHIIQPPVRNIISPPTTNTSIECKSMWSSFFPLTLAHCIGSAAGIIRLVLLRSYVHPRGDVSVCVCVCVNSRVSGIKSPCFFGVLTRDVSCGHNLCAYNTRIRRDRVRAGVSDPKASPWTPWEEESREEDADGETRPGPCPFRSRRRAPRNARNFHSASPGGGRASAPVRARSIGRQIVCLRTYKRERMKQTTAPEKLPPSRAHKHKHDRRTHTPR